MCGTSAPSVTPITGCKRLSRPICVRRQAPARSRSHIAPTLCSATAPCVALGSDLLVRSTSCIWPPGMEEMQKDCKNNPCPAVVGNCSLRCSTSCIPTVVGRKIKPKHILEPPRDERWCNIRASLPSATMRWQITIIGRAWDQAPQRPRSPRVANDMRRNVRRHGHAGMVDNSSP